MSVKGLLDKLTKFKDNKNVKGQQKIYKKILINHPEADLLLKKLPLIEDLSF